MSDLQAFSQHPLVGYCTNKPIESAAYCRYEINMEKLLLKKREIYFDYIIKFLIPITTGKLLRLAH